MVAAVVLGVALLARDEATPLVVPESLVKIDPATNTIVDDVPVGKNPGPAVIVGRYVFVASEDEGTLYRVDMRSGEVATSGRYDANGMGIAAEGNSWVWVASIGRSSAGWASVVRVGARSLQSFGRIRLPRYSSPLGIAVGGGSLWVSERTPPAVSRWSLRTLRLQRRYKLSKDSSPFLIGFGEGAAWVGDSARSRLLRIDAESGRMMRIPVGDTPVSPVVAFGSVWVQTFNGPTLWRLDLFTAKPRAIIPVPEAPLGLAAGAGAVWVGGHCGGVVSRIDPDTDSVVTTIETGEYPRGPAVGGGFVWVGVVGEPSVFC